MTFDQLECNAEHLSVSVLSEPWQLSEQKIRLLMGQFQELMQGLPAQIPQNTEAGKIKAVLGQTQKLIAAIQTSVGTRSILELSEILASDFLNLIAEFNEIIGSKTDA
jgi:hypothetical protein